MKKQTQEVENMLIELVENAEFSQQGAAFPLHLVILSGFYYTKYKPSILHLDGKMKKINKNGLGKWARKILYTYLVVSCFC